MISQDYSRAILSGRYIDLLMVSGVQLSSGKSVRCNDKIYLTLWPLALADFKSENEREELCYGNIQPRTQPIPMDLPYDWKWENKQTSLLNNICKMTNLKIRNKAGGTACPTWVGLDNATEVKTAVGRTNKKQRRGEIQSAPFAQGHLP